MEIEIRSKEGKLRAVATKLEYNGEWMGECSVTVDVESPYPIDFEVGDRIEYRGERFELHYEPGVHMTAMPGTYGAAYKYEGIKFVSQAEELVNCDFLDYVLNDNEIHFSGLPDFSFFAESVRDLANRIQANMNRYSDQNGGGRWQIEVAEGAEGNTRLNISVSNISCQAALALVNSEFGLNYTIKGRKVTIGGAGLPADHIFKMGREADGRLNGLYEFDRQAETDQKVVTRLRAYGSQRNLPRRYYNSLTDADGKKLVPDNMAVNRLMLPSFPYDTLDPYIDSPNIGKIGVREATVVFDGSGDLEEIYPSIEEATAEELKKAGYETTAEGRLDEIAEGSHVEDNGEGEEKGDEIIPQTETFTVRIKDIGFDIMDYLTDEEPKISFKSGKLGGREFEILTGEHKPVKNTDGTWTLTLNREYDESIQLFFPYSRYNAEAGDRFVLLGIDMPESYIKMSSQRLLTAAQGWLKENDYPRSVYTPKIDEVFMDRQHREHPESSLYMNIKEGDLLMFEESSLYMGVSSIFIDKLTIKEGEGPAPTYEVTLREEKVAGTLERIKNAIDSIKNGGVGGGGYSADQIRQFIQTFGMRYFLRKDGMSDTSYSRTFFDEAISSLNFREGMAGGQGWGLFKDENGKSVAEVDYLHVRDEAVFNSLLINQIKAMGGMYVFTVADAELTRVERVGDVYRCWFKTDENYIANLFREDDVAYCHHYDPQNQDYQTPKYYKRRVVGLGEDYIDMAASGDVSGSGVPEKGDTVITYGNYSDKRRQYVIILDVQGGGYLRFLKDLDSVHATGREYGFQGYQPSTGERWFIGDKDGEYAEWVKGKLNINGTLSVTSTIGGQSLRDYFSALIPDLKQEDIESFVKAITGQQFQDLQEQIDGAIDTFYATGRPTLGNYPANDWKTDEDRDKHIGDLYYDRETGFGYRFMKDEAGEYVWTLIKDEEITKALAESEAASNLAKSKRRIFGTVPYPPYEEGDLWVNATWPEGAKKEDAQYWDDILRCKRARASGDFDIDDWELASKYTDDTKAEQALDEIAGYEYLRDALEDGVTTVSGGLILSSLIQLGGKDSLGAWQVWSGLNGVYTKPEGIAAWYGGDMWDLANDYDASKERRYAATLFRFDGSGYLANNNIGWRKDGSGWLAGGNITWDEKGAMTFGTGIHIGSGDSDTTVATLLNFAQAFIPIDQEKKETTWSKISTSNPLFAIKAKAGFFSESFISAMGLNSETGSGGSGGGGLNEEQLADYLTRNNYAKKSDIATDLGKYLPLTGGTITGNLDVEGYFWIKSSSGEIGFNILDNRFFGPTVASNGKFELGRSDARWSTLYANSINVTNTALVGNLNADMLDGKHNGELTAENLSYLGNTEAIGGTTAIDKGLRLYGVYNNGYPCMYGNLLRIGGGGGGELLAEWTGGNGLGRLYYRSKRDVQSEWSGWGTVAYLTDNVASATQLQASRNLWGQPFNGTGDVDGVMEINYTGNDVYNAFLQATDPYIPVNGHGGLAFGKAKSTNNQAQIWHTHIGDGSTNNYLSFGAWGKPDLMIVRYDGSVGIGTTTLPYKFTVNGDILADGWIRVRGGGNRGFFFESYGGGFYMQDGEWIRTYGSKNFYHDTGIMRTDGEFQVGINGNRLIVKPGGNVGIGISNPAFTLDVRGTGYFSGNVTAEANLWVELLLSANQVYAVAGIWSDGYVSAMGQNTSSDERLKMDFRPLKLTLEQIANAPSVMFRWKKDGSLDFGSIAQYWQRINPLFAREHKGYLTLDYGKIAMSGLIAVSNEVQARINKLEREVGELKGLISMNREFRV